LKVAVADRLPTLFIPYGGGPCVFMEPTWGLPAEAPGAHESRPEPEHLLPPMVAAGAAGEDRGLRTYHDHVAGKPLSGFQFG
jgi:hypothetical protein